MNEPLRTPQMRFAKPDRGRTDAAAKRVATRPTAALTGSHRLRAIARLAAAVTILALCLSPAFMAAMQDGTSDHLTGYRGASTILL